MNQYKKNGMWIRQTEPVGRKETGWILSMIVAMFSSGIWLLTVGKLTGFDEIYVQWVMLISASCVCIAYGIIAGYKKQKWFLPGFLFLLLVLVVFGGTWILNGFCMFVNQLGDTWTAGCGSVLPELAISSKAEDICLLLFSVFMGSVTALFCCVVTSFEKRILGLILPVFLLAGMLLFRQESTFVYLIPVLLFAVCLMACNGRQEVKRPMTAMLYRWVPILCSSMLLLFLAVMPKVENWAIGIGEKTQERLHISRYETAYTTLPEGDFTDYTEKEGEDKTALVVSMEQPEELYLRGFTGAVFEGDIWRTLDTEILEEQEDLLYWLNQNGWNPHTLFSQAVSPKASHEDTKEETKQSVTVQNLNACSKYLYVPYNLCAGDYLETKKISPDGVMSDGTRLYLYSIQSGGTEVIQKTLQELRGTEDEALLSYLQAENAYREFVYQYYLDIPQEVADLLLPYWDETAAAYGTVGELTPEQAQACVLDFLERCFPEDGENVEFMLPLSIAEDTSYQYATVAAMTLRYFGIPSRYVEGYVITEEMAENAEDGSSIKVDSSHGGAWAEVYQDGIGWLPMDVTLGIEKQEVTANENGEDGDTPKEKPPKGQELEEEPEDILEEPEPQGGYVVSIPKMISWTFLLILLFLLVLILLLIVRRKLLLKKKQKRWNAENTKDAVGWIFADTAEILERLGFHRGNGSMQDLMVPIEQRFGEAYAKEYKQMVMLNARAMFSSRELLEEHRASAKMFYAATLQHLKKSEKWYKKLWMQWVLCLY